MLSCCLAVLSSLSALAATLAPQSTESLGPGKTSSSCYHRCLTQKADRKQPLENCGVFRHRRKGKNHFSYDFFANGILSQKELVKYLSDESLKLQCWLFAFLLFFSGRRRRSSQKSIDGKTETHYNNSRTHLQREEERDCVNKEKLSV